MYESVYSQKVEEIKEMKAKKLQDELKLIQSTDAKARFLERKEERILSRLKQTHNLQQQTLY